MREIKMRKSFRKDIKRADGGIYRLIVKRELWVVVDMLANGMPLPAKYRDHALHGDWEGSRDCHIGPDFLLLYTYESDNVLWLERLGSHAEIFGM